jgi:hypothetical protein
MSSQELVSFSLPIKLDSLVKNSFYILNETLSCVGAVFVKSCRFNKLTNNFEYLCKPIASYLSPRPTSVSSELEKELLYSFEMETSLPKTSLCYGELSSAYQFFSDPSFSFSNCDGFESGFSDAVGKFSELDRFLFLKDSQEVRVFDIDFNDVSDRFKEFLSFAETLSSDNLIFSAIFVGDYFSVNDLYFNGRSLCLLSYQERLKELNELKYNNYFKQYQIFTISSKQEFSAILELLSELQSTRGCSYFNLNSSLLTFEQFPDKNEEYFDKFTPESCYFLGFICSDGHVSDDDHRIEIRISSIDKSILKRLAVVLNKDSIIDKEGYSKFRFASVYMYNKLKELGVTGDKANRTVHNKIPSEYSWCFAKGVFDADGSVTKDRIQIDSANKNLMNWLCDLFNTIGSAKVYDYDSYSKVVVMKEDAEKVLAKMNECSYGLSRKTKLK